MASQADTALDQLNHIIDATFSSIRKYKPFDRYTTLQSLYTALDHQLEDGLLGQQESDHMRFIVGKVWDLKLQIHMIEKEDAQLNDVIGHVIVDVGLALGGYNFKIIVCLRVHVFVFEMMSQLIAKGIIRSYSMQQRQVAVNPVTGIISNCDVCGGLMFNAQHYMHMNNSYFALSMIWFPYEMKVYDRI